MRRASTAPATCREHVTDYFMKQPAVRQRHGGRRLQPARQPEQEQRRRRSSSASRVSTSATSRRTSGRRTRARCCIGAYEALSQVKEGIILPVNPPSIPGLGTTGGTEIWIQSKGDATHRAAGGRRGRVRRQGQGSGPNWRGVTSTFNASSQQLLVDVDRDKAETLGVPIEDVYSAMQTMFGSLYVSQFNRSSRLWQVILQAEPTYRLKPEDLEQIFVRSKTGDDGAAQGGRDHHAT